MVYRWLTQAGVACGKARNFIMKLKSIAAAVALLTAGAAAHGASASVLLFEDFNSATQGLNWGGNANFNVGSPPGSVDLIGTGFYDLYPGHGNYVDLDGSTGNGNNPAGQLISTQVFGAGTYTLEFLLGGNNRGAGARTTTFSIGNWSTVVGPLASNSGLGSYSFTFTTTGGALNITQTGPSNQQGNVIDDIKVSAVPEPTTWAMMIVGFGVAGAMVRSRRKLALAA